MNVERAEMLRELEPVLTYLADELKAEIPHIVHATFCPSAHQAMVPTGRVLPHDRHSPGYFKRMRTGCTGPPLRPVYRLR